ncbi:hypothetical protein [Demequina soli]|uniref:hypothetical protein n=1 Tax=Demequina soli TaxID=1638987 RepID=UPI000783F3B3|nr:hypothetical protein [Demequina soli]
MSAERWLSEGWDEGVSGPGERVYGTLSDASESLREEFLASDHRPRNPGRCAACALDLVLAFAEVVALGGTMRWDGRVVGHLLRAAAPGFARPDCGALDALPVVLPALVRFMHARDGTDASTSKEVADEIHTVLAERRELSMWEDEEADPWLRGAAAREAETRRRARLAVHVGGPDVLEALDAEPLPDEEFVWDGIAEDIRDRVGEHLALLDEVADEHLDVEHRTAMRRFLARVAIADPRIFRRPSSVLRGATGVAFAVCEANDTIASFRQGANGKVLAGWFGVDGGASDRAEAMRRAIGAPIVFRPTYLRTPRALGSADLLVSTRRAEIVAERDREDGAGGEAL